VLYVFLIKRIYKLAIVSKHHSLKNCLQNCNRILGHICINLNGHFQIITSTAVIIINLLNCLIKLKEPNIGKQYKTLPQQSRVLLKR